MQEAPHMPIKTRKQASEDGDVRYWTGKACKNGHLSPRYVSTTACCECQRLATNSYKDVSQRNYRTVRLWCHEDDEPVLKLIAERMALARKNVKGGDRLASLPAQSLVTPPDGYRALRDQEHPGPDDRLYNYATGQFESDPGAPVFITHADRQKTVAQHYREAREADPDNTVIIVRALDLGS